MSDDYRIYVFHFKSCLNLDKVYVYTLGIGHMLSCRSALLIVCNNSGSHI